MIRSSGALWIALIAIGFGGCRLTEDEKIAAKACRDHGVQSRECRYVARRIKDAVEVKQSFAQQMGAWRLEEESAAQALAAEAALAAEGKDPCDVLRERIRSETTVPVCDTGVSQAMEFLEQDGCGTWLNDFEGAMEEARIFLEECGGGE